MKAIHKSWISVLFFGFSCTLSATSLGDKVAQMQPGTWTEFNTTGFTGDLISTGQDNVLNYANSAIWDPVRKEVRFVGQGHMESEKMIVYSDAANGWSTAGSPGGGGIGHAFDHNAIDPATGTGYYKKYSSTSVYRYSNGSWGSTVSLPGAGSEHSCCASLEYFPEMHALIFSGGGYAWKLQNNVWTRLNTGALAMSGYSNAGEYSAPYKAVFFGGGHDNRELYRLDSTGMITRMADAPIGFGVYSGHTVADPATGEFLIAGGDKSFHAFNPALNKWRTLPAPPAGLWHTGENPLNFLVIAPISTYGVVMFLRGVPFNPGRIYLYKHSLATGLAVAGGMPMPNGVGFSVRPNPMRGRVSVRFQGAECGTGMHLSIFSVQGRHVADLPQTGPVTAWDASALPAGVYLLRAMVDGRTFVKTVTLMK